MFLQKRRRKGWCLLCFCLAMTFIAGPIGSGKAAVTNSRAHHPAEIHVDNLTGIKQGDPIGILYYQYLPDSGQWVVGIHNGVALVNLRDNMPDVPLGHYGSTAFNEKALCFHKQTENDILGGYRRIDVEPYPDSYTHAVPIGYQVGNTVNNAAFARFDPDPIPGDPNPHPITDAKRAIAFLHNPSNAGRTGTLYYGHWNIKPSTTTKGAYTPVWEENFKTDVNRIELLGTNIPNDCILT